ncbi:MAG: hypothetical protein ACLPLZ_04115 [Terracidiphilus sp.]
MTAAVSRATPDYWCTPEASTKPAVCTESAPGDDGRFTSDGKALT